MRFESHVRFHIFISVRVTDLLPSYLRLNYTVTDKHKGEMHLNEERTITCD